MGCSSTDILKRKKQTREPKGIVQLQLKSCSTSGKFLFLCRPYVLIRCAHGRLNAALLLGSHVPWMGSGMWVKWSYYHVGLTDLLVLMVFILLNMQFVYCSNCDCHQTETTWLCWFIKQQFPMPIFGIFGCWRYSELWNGGKISEEVHGSSKHRASRYLTDRQLCDINLTMTLKEFNYNFNRLILPHPTNALWQSLDEWIGDLSVHKRNCP